MQGWQDLLMQISVGLLVNAIIGIFCWLIKREFLFFKKKLLFPRSLGILPKQKNILTSHTPIQQPKPVSFYPGLLKKILISYIIFSWV